MNNLIRSQIDAIHSDNTSGAAQLTRKAAEILTSAAETGDLAEVAAALVRAQPSMASIFNLANAALLGIATPHDFIDRMARAVESIARTAASLIADDTTVMTHSRSQTVLSALLAAKQAGRQFRVICTESRPMREGVTLARELDAAGIPATLIIDAAILRFLPDAHLVLVGADSVSARGVTNKIGTSLLALAAKTLAKDIYVLCGSEKFLPANRPLPAETPKDPSEIVPLAPDPWPLTPAVLNYYFDLTPLDWFTGIITEDGILDPAHLAQRLGQMQVHPILT